MMKITFSSPLYFCLSLFFPAWTWTHGGMVEGRETELFSNQGNTFQSTDALLPIYCVGYSE